MPKLVELILTHLDPSSELKKITYDFPPNLWNEKKWIGWLYELKEKGIDIKIVGYKVNKKSYKTIQKLLEDDIIKARIIPPQGIIECIFPPSDSTFHLILADPEQLLVEAYHGPDGIAKNLTFTPEPHNWVWKDANKYFEVSCTKGKELTIKDLKES
jgi:hypothetical protein